MGIDISYQAMPEDCGLLQQARSDAEFGAKLEFFKTYASPSYTLIKGFTIDPRYSEFVRAAQTVAVEHPQLEQRNYDLGRHWDMLYYLLSERRRTGKPRDWSHWVEQALFGGDVLNEATQTTIGSPIRYLFPAQVRAVAPALASITPAALDAYWNPVAMYAAGVYKIYPNESADSLTWLHTDLEKLQAFYALVASHNEGILTFVG